MIQTYSNSKNSSNNFQNVGNGGSYVSNSLFSNTRALQAYNPTVNANFNNTGTRSQNFTTSKTIREIDINSFIIFFIISAFLILMITLF